ncbi:uncharacterized protein LOC115052674 isoform X2 [Echeneis naucrates]|uniref:uncharacterized protein LOC115052674 isoform X2 n=1 Tax=Echeneis naucrates TaxID=173247 RepID=UPI00111334D5|nr:uncharacterized protein LOC115052674 isoform X2 [Echeneis naucrates]
MKQQHWQCVVNKQIAVCSFLTQLQCHLITVYESFPYLFFLKLKMGEWMCLFVCKYKKSAPLSLFQVKVSILQQVQWSGRQLREAVLELRDSSETEAQRRAAQHYPLALIVPPHVLHILTLGDEEEWDHQALFHSELLLGLDKVDVCMEQLQQDQEKWTAQGGDWAATVNALAREMRHRDVWEQCMSRQTELETALAALHFVRHHSQLRANTAQAVLCGNLWYREFGLVQCQQPREQAIGLLQQRMLPILERLNQLLEDKQPQHSSVLSAKQAYGLEIDSRVWTSSMPVVKGNSNHSLREPLSLAQSQDTVLQTNSAPTHNSQQTASLGIHSQAEEKPRIAQTEEDWNKLLQLSPLFHLVRAVELQLRGWACGAGLLQGERRDGGKSFVDVLDAQWECEGELIPLDLSVLNPREFLVYQHGLFLIHTLHNLNLTPPISLHIAASLPNNNYLNNAFRNSFFYQELEGMLFVRRQRLHSVGGFSLLLLHCLSHIKVKDMTTDSSPVFQRLFYKVIQACLGELFQTRLDMPPCGQEANWCSGGLHRTLSDSLDSSLFDKLHKPSRGLQKKLDNSRGSSEKHLCFIILKVF